MILLPPRSTRTDTTFPSTTRFRSWHLRKITHLLPDLHFTRQQAGGGEVHAEDFRGRPVLLYFGYTHCPDICPTTLARLRAVKQALGTEGDKLQDRKSTRLNSSH